MTSNAATSGPQRRGLGQTPRARQPRAAANHGVSVVALGPELSRFTLYGIAIYFFLFAPSARRHSLRYLRLALGREPPARDRFRQILSFATTIHDRVYLINGQFEIFNISSRRRSQGAGA